MPDESPCFSGYDFGYLLKVLTANPLPSDEGPFLRLLGLFFPRFYDIKYLMKSCKNLKGGLQDIADDLGVSRVGTQHQAGSDSHLTCLAFFRLQQLYFDGSIDEDKYMNNLYGIGSGNAPFAGAPASNPLQASSESVSGLNLDKSFPSPVFSAPDPNAILLSTSPFKRK
jgi:CCR4-NOT transcription complex subunit 7/8